MPHGVNSGPYGSFYNISILNTSNPKKDHANMDGSLNISITRLELRSGNIFVEKLSADYQTDAMFVTAVIHDVIFCKSAIDAVPCNEETRSLTMDTNGSTAVYITGNFFIGSPGNVPQISHFSTYSPTVVIATACHLVSARLVKCNSTGEGAGADRTFVVAIEEDGLHIGVPWGGNKSYSLPSISSLTPEGDGSLAIFSSSWVTIHGANFGPKNDAYISAMYYNERALARNITHFYSTVVCYVIESHVTINCSSQPLKLGFLRDDLKWKVTVANQMSQLSSSSVYYAKPTINYLNFHTNLNTAGGEIVQIIGDNFGPLGCYHDSCVKAVYKSSDFASTLNATNCTIKWAGNHVNQTMECRTASGVGRGFQWKVYIEDIFSGYSIDNRTQYRRPTVVNVSIFETGAKGLDTVSYTEVDIKGLNFGPDPLDWFINATYGPYGYEYAAVDCALVVANVHIRCKSVPAVPNRNRTHLVWVISVANFPSLVSTAYIQYNVPVVSQLTGDAWMSTSGNNDIIIAGDSFGPPGSRVTTAYYKSVQGGVLYGPYFPNCTVKSNNELTCISSPGVGGVFDWFFGIEGQDFVPGMKTNTSYRRPQVSAVSSRNVSKCARSNGSLVLSAIEQCDQTHVIQHNVTALIIHGSNFGPLGTAVYVSFHRSPGMRTLYYEPGCQLAGAGSELLGSRYASSPVFSPHHVWSTQTYGQTVFSFKQTGVLWVPEEGVYDFVVEFPDLQEAPFGVIDALTVSIGSELGSYQMNYSTSSFSHIFENVFSYETGVFPIPISVLFDATTFSGERPTWFSSSIVTNTSNTGTASNVQVSFSYSRSLWAHDEVRIKLPSFGCDGLVDGIYSCRGRYTSWRINSTTEGEMCTLSFALITPVHRRAEPCALHLEGFLVTPTTPQLKNHKNRTISVVEKSGRVCSADASGPFEDAIKSSPAFGNFFMDTFVSLDDNRIGSNASITFRFRASMNLTRHENITLSLPGFGKDTSAKSVSGFGNSVFCGNSSWVWYWMHDVETMIFVQNEHSTGLMAGQICQLTAISSDAAWTVPNGSAVTVTVYSYGDSLTATHDVSVITPFGFLASIDGGLAISPPFVGTSITLTVRFTAHNALVPNTRVGLKLKGYNVTDGKIDLVCASSTIPTMKFLPHEQLNDELMVTLQSAIQENSVCNVSISSVQALYIHAQNEVGVYALHVIYPGTFSVYFPILSSPAVSVPSFVIKMRRNQQIYENIFHYVSDFIADSAVSKCTVHTSHNEIRCSNVPPGLGNNSIVVKLGQQSSLKSSNGFPFPSPSILALSKSLVSTGGGDTFAIDGHHFGPAGTYLDVSYGAYSASFCRTEDTSGSFVEKLVCISAPGMAQNHNFVIEETSFVGGPVLSYISPSISALSTYNFPNVNITTVVGSRYGLLRMTRRNKTGFIDEDGVYVHVFGQSFGNGQPPVFWLGSQMANVVSYTENDAVLKMRVPAITGLTSLKVCHSQACSSGGHSVMVNIFEFHDVGPTLGNSKGGAGLYVTGIEFQGFVTAYYIRLFHSTHTIFQTALKYESSKRLVSTTPRMLSPAILVPTLSMDGLNFFLPKKRASGYYRAYENPVVYSFYPKHGSVLGGTKVKFIANFFPTGSVTARFDDIIVQCDVLTLKTFQCTTPFLSRPASYFVQDIPVEISIDPVAPRRFVKCDTNFSFVDYDSYPSTASLESYMTPINGPKRALNATFWNTTIMDEKTRPKLLLTKNMILKVPTLTKSVLQVSDAVSSESKLHFTFIAENFLSFEIALKLPGFELVTNSNMAITQYGCGKSRELLANWNATTEVFSFAVGNFIPLVPKTLCRVSTKFNIFRTPKAGVERNTLPSHVYYRTGKFSTVLANVTMSDRQSNEIGEYLHGVSMKLAELTTDTQTNMTLHINASNFTKQGNVIRRLDISLPGFRYAKSSPFTQVFSDHNATWNGEKSSIIVIFLNPLNSTTLSMTELNFEGVITPSTASPENAETWKLRLYSSDGALLVPAYTVTNSPKIGVIALVTRDIEIIQAFPHTRLVSIRYRFTPKTFIGPNTSINIDLPGFTFGGELHVSPNSNNCTDTEFEGLWDDKFGVLSITTRGSLYPNSSICSIFIASGFSAPSSSANVYSNLAIRLSPPGININTLPRFYIQQMKSFVPFFEHNTVVFSGLSSSIGRNPLVTGIVYRFSSTMTLTQGTSVVLTLPHFSYAYSSIRDFSVSCGLFSQLSSWNVNWVSEKNELSFSIETDNVKDDSMCTLSIPYGFIYDGDGDARASSVMMQDGLVVVPVTVVTIVNDGLVGLDSQIFQTHLKRCLNKTRCVCVQTTCSNSTTIELRNTALSFNIGFRADKDAIRFSFELDSWTRVMVNTTIRLSLPGINVTAKNSSISVFGCFNSVWEGSWNVGDSIAIIKLVDNTIDPSARCELMLTDFVVVKSVPRPANYDGFKVQAYRYGVPISRFLSIAKSDEIGSVLLENSLFLSNNGLSLLSKGSYRFRSSDAIKETSTITLRLPNFIFEGVTDISMWHLIPCETNAPGYACREKINSAKVVNGNKNADDVIEVLPGVSLLRFAAYEIVIDNLRTPSQESAWNPQDRLVSIAEYVVGLPIDSSPAIGNNYFETCQAVATTPFVDSSTTLSFTFRLYSSLTRGSIIQVTLLRYRFAENYAEHVSCNSTFFNASFVPRLDTLNFHLHSSVLMPSTDCTITVRGGITTPDIPIAPNSRQNKAIVLSPNGDIVVPSTYLLTSSSISDREDMILYGHKDHTSTVHTEFRIPTPSIVTETTYKAYISWEDHNFELRNPMSESILFYDIPVPAFNVKKVTPRSGPMWGESMIEILFNTWTNVSTLRVRDESKKTEIIAVDLIIPIPPRGRFRIPKSSRHGSTVFSVSLNGLDFHPLHGLPFYYYRAPYLQLIEPKKSVKMEGGDRIILLGAFHDTGTIHLKSVPDFNMTVCSHCVLLGAEEEVCSKCPSAYRRCGDGRCSPARGENTFSCPEDCGCGGRYCHQLEKRHMSDHLGSCGDGICHKNESCSFNSSQKAEDVIDTYNGNIVVNVSSVVYKIGHEINISGCEDVSSNFGFYVVAAKYVLPRKINASGTYFGDHNCLESNKDFCDHAMVLTLMHSGSHKLFSEIANCSLKHSKFDGCIADCGLCDSVMCGDGVCEGDEGCQSCPHDCFTGNSSSCQSNLALVPTDSDEIVRTSSCEFLNVSAVSCIAGDVTHLIAPHFTRVYISVDVPAYTPAKSIRWSNSAVMFRHNSSFGVSSVSPSRIIEKRAPMSVIVNDFVDISHHESIAGDSHPEIANDEHRFYENSACGINTTAPMLLADRFRFYRKVRITNPGNSTLVKSTIPLQIDTTVAVRRRRMRSDCSDIFLTGNHWEKIEDFRYWLDPYSCNSTKTTVWIKVSSLEGHQTLLINIIYGLKHNFDFEDRQKTRGWDIFDHFYDPRTLLNAQIVSPHLNKTKLAYDRHPEIFGEHPFSLSRFRHAALRPYVVEASIAQKLGGAPTIVFSSDSDNFDVESENIQKSITWLCHSDDKEMNATISASVHQVGRVLSIDSTCVGTERFQLPLRQEDYVYFGGLSGTAKFNWVGIRAAVTPSPLVSVSTELKGTHLLQCNLPKSYISGAGPLRVWASVNYESAAINTSQAQQRVEIVKSPIIENITPDSFMISGLVDDVLKVKKQAQLKTGFLNTIARTYMRLPLIDAAGDIVCDLNAGEYMCTMPNISARWNYENISIASPVELSVNGLQFGDFSNSSISYSSPSTCRALEDSFDNRPYLKSLWVTPNSNTVLVLATVQNGEYLTSPKLLSNPDPDYPNPLKVLNGKRMVERSALINGSIETRQIDTVCGVSINFDAVLVEDNTGDGVLTIKSNTNGSPKLRLKYTRNEHSCKSKGEIMWDNLNSQACTSTLGSDSWLHVRCDFSAVHIAAHNRKTRFCWETESEQSWLLDNVQIITKPCTLTKAISLHSLSPDAGPAAGKTIVTVGGVFPGLSSDMATELSSTVYCKFGDQYSPHVSIEEEGGSVVVKCESPPLFGVCISVENSELPHVEKKTACEKLDVCEYFNFQCIRKICDTDTCADLPECVSTGTSCTLRDSNLFQVPVSVGFCGAVEGFHATKFLYYSTPRVQGLFVETDSKMVISESGLSPSSLQYDKALDNANVDLSVSLEAFPFYLQSGLVYNFGNLKIALVPLDSIEDTLKLAKYSDIVKSKAITSPAEISSYVSTCNSDSCGLVTHSFLSEALFHLPEGETYGDVGFPLTGNVKYMVYQAVYVQSDMSAVGISDGDDLYGFSLKMASIQCARLTTIKMKVAVIPWASTDDEIAFFSGSYMYEDSSLDFTDIETIVATNPCKGANMNEWIDFRFSQGETLQVGDENEALLVEISEKAETTNSESVGVVLRHTYDKQSVRWVSTTETEIRPVDGSVVFVDERVPAIKFDTNKSATTLKLNMGVRKSHVVANNNEESIREGFVTLTFNGDYRTSEILFMFHPTCDIDTFSFKDTKFHCMPIQNSVIPDDYSLVPNLGPVDESTSTVLEGSFSNSNPPYIVIRLQEPVNDGRLPRRIRRYYFKLNRDTGSSFIGTRPETTLMGRHESKFYTEFNVFVSTNGLHFLYKSGTYWLYDSPSMDSYVINEINGTEVPTVANGGFSVEITGDRFLNSEFLRCRWGASCNNPSESCTRDAFGGEVTLEMEKLTSDQLYGPPAEYVDESVIRCVAPARPIGEWKLFVGNNGANYGDGGNNLKVTFKPCQKGKEAQFYYQECLNCKPGKFDADPQRYEREIVPGQDVYPIFCTPCEIGQYQENLGAVECIVCPPGATTLGLDPVGNLFMKEGSSKRSRDCSCIGAKLQQGDTFYQKTVDDATFNNDPTICYWDRGGNTNGGCCTPCEIGGQCDGGNISMYNQDGFYQQEDNSFGRQTLFYQCSPQSACAPCDDECHSQNALCRQAAEDEKPYTDSRGVSGMCRLQCFCDSYNCYDGENCASCAKKIVFEQGKDHQGDIGNFFRQDGDCVRCPIQNSATTALAVVVFFLFLYGFTKVSQYFRGLGAMRIIMNWLSMSVGFAGFDIEWPPEVIAFFTFLKQLNFIDIDVMSPECAINMKYEDAWLYFMMLPLVIAAALLFFYVLTSSSSNPFGSAKQRAAAKDPDTRKLWVSFSKKFSAPAWAFINELRAGSTFIFVRDSVDDTEWFLDPADAVQYDSMSKTKVRLWKKTDTEMLAESWIKIHVDRSPHCKSVVAHIEAGTLDTSSTDNFDICKGRIELSPALLQELRLPSANPIPLKRYIRQVHSRDIRLAGFPFNERCIRSDGNCIAAVRKSGKIELAQKLACQFGIDESINSSVKEFSLSTIELDIDGPSSTTSSKYVLRVKVTIQRSRHDIPTSMEAVIAEETINILGPGIVSVNFTEVGYISHYHKANYWIVVEPLSTHLEGAKAFSARWYWRHAKRNKMFSDTVCAHAILDLDGVDALDFGADTSTKFIPLRSGLKIEGVNNWGAWESLRVAAAQQEYNEIQRDPSRYGTPIRCTKTHPFAFQVRGEYPNTPSYTAGMALRNRNENQPDIECKSSEAPDSERNEVDEDVPPNEENSNETLNPKSSCIPKAEAGPKLAHAAFTELQKEEELAFTAKEALIAKPLGALLYELELYATHHSNTKSFKERTVTFLKILSKCFKREEVKFKKGICGKFWYEPLRLLFVILKILFTFFYTFLWTFLMVVGAGLWFVYATLVSVFSTLRLLLDERQLLALKFHIYVLRCKGLNWRVSAVILSSMFGFFVLYGFIGDVGLNWLSDTMDIIFPLLSNPDLRYYYIAPAFLFCVMAYSMSGAHNSLHDLEALDPLVMQNIVYYNPGDDIPENFGIVVQKLGKAIAVRSDISGAIDVIHARDVLKVGVVVSDELNDSQVDPGDAEELSKDSHHSDIQQALRLYSASGEFRVNLTNGEKWNKWLKRRTDSSHRLTSWTWYDKMFSKHMLRYVVTTPVLKDFEAHRNSLMQVKEMHKIRLHAGSVGQVGHRDKANLFINTYFILFITIHLSMTKKIIGMLLCTQQADGKMTLNESPAIECWIGPHIFLSNLAFFFFALYSIGFPLFAIIKISGVFKAKREFDPNMRDRYGYLYYKYKTTHFLWEPLAIMPRKVFVAVFRILTREKKFHLLQASGVMIVLAGLAILQIQQQPFIEQFLNNMENVALVNHVFVLFFGVMFLSKALQPVGPGVPPGIMTQNAFALIMISHMFGTFLYLSHGVFIELWEMGIFQAGLDDIKNLILQQRSDSLKLIRRTVRSHWALRPLATIFKRQKRKETLGGSKKKQKHLAGTAHINKVGQHHFPPPPPEAEPPVMNAEQWICAECNFENDAENNPYVVTCRKCEKKRPFTRFKDTLSLAEKKRALGYEVDILKSVLLSQDAQAAAIDWGIDDRSTTLRETIWLLKALESTCKNVLQVFFNIKQLEKQEAMQLERKQRFSGALYVFKPFIEIWDSISTFFGRNMEFDEKENGRQWIERRDPISRRQYFIYKDSFTMLESECTVENQGWYEFFDGKLTKPFYAFLGEFGWQHTTWKRPHEVGLNIMHGTSRVGRGPMVIMNEKPAETTHISNMKIKLLDERLKDFDFAMDRIEQLVGKGVPLPHFTLFKDMLAELLDIDLIRSTLDTQYGENANVIRREAARLCISMPLCPQEKSGKSREFSGVVSEGK